jgi:hypothetical protein
MFWYTKIKYYLKIFRDLVFERYAIVSVRLIILILHVLNIYKNLMIYDEFDLLID